MLDVLNRVLLPLIVVLVLLGQSYRFTQEEKRLIWPEWPLNQAITVMGTVQPLPQVHVDYQRFKAHLSQWCDASDCHSIDIQVPMTWSDVSETLLSGEQWQWTVRLRQTSQYRNPHGRWPRVLFSPYQGRVLKGQLLQASHRQTWRERIYQVWQTWAPTDRHAGVMLALSIGDGHHLSSSTRQVLQQTGTAHALSISGLHVGFVGLLCLMGLRRLGVMGAPVVTALPTAAVIVIYGALAGWQLPVTRAVVMMLIALVAEIFWVSSSPLNRWCYAALVVGMIWPNALQTASFWLSFGAVLSLLYWHTQTNGWRHSTRWIGASIWLTLTQWPVLAYFFGSLSWIAPVANAVVIPVVSMLMVPLGLLAALLAVPLPSVSHLLWSLMSSIWHPVIWLLTQMGPLGDLKTHPGFGLGSALGLSWAIWRLLQPNARYKGIVLSLGLVLLFWQPKPVSLKTGEFALTVLDVGQGLSTVIHTAHHVVVFDTGPPMGRHQNAGRAVIAPYLRYWNHSSIDALVLSHQDADHIGGASSLMSEFAVKRRYQSFADDQKTTRYQWCDNDTQWSFDGVQFAFITPPAVQAQLTSKNDRSCVLMVSTDTARVLIPGDIEHRAERWLASQVPASVKADVLIASHHGSKTGSSAEFLTAVQPSVVILSYGAGNRYGHPHHSVLARIKDYEVYDTAKQGGIMGVARHQQKMRFVQLPATMGGGRYVE